MDNRLYRDKSKAILGGVAAGIGEQLKLDITLIRALFILLVLFGKIGIAATFVAYCVLWICLPAIQSSGPIKVNPLDADDQRFPSDDKRFASDDKRFVADYKVDPSASETEKRKFANPGFKSGNKVSDSSTILGFILVGLGAIMLADRFIVIDWDFLDRFWPLALVAAGLVIVFKARK